jgi:dipeptidyl-peptidase-4
MPASSYPIIYVSSTQDQVHSQVANRWNSANDYWYQMLAQQGYYCGLCRWYEVQALRELNLKKVTQK